VSTADQDNALASAAKAGLRPLLRTAIDSGLHRIGQVAIQPADGGFRIRHVEDAGIADLEEFRDPHDASTIALWDDEGKYRPVKTGPNLRRGWEMVLSDIAELHLAVDLLYPAALGNWRSVLLGERPATSLRDTVNRQTGMYRVTGLVTDDEARGLLDTVCRPGCLRTILWPLRSGAPQRPTPAPDGSIPLLCTDCCAPFIAAVRTTVKERMKKTQPPS
jgi:hypothetical protein